MINFNIRKLFSKHPLYRLKEIKSVRPYYIGFIRTKNFVENASCFFEPTNMIQQVHIKRRKVTDILLNHFDPGDFLVLTFINDSIKIYEAELLVNIHLETKQELQLGNKFSLFKERMTAIDGVCGIIIVFRKKNHQILTELSKCFGEWK